MNRQRRERIVQLIAKLCDIRDELHDLRDEEQDSHDNLPDSLQEGERGQASQDAADMLDEVGDEVGDASDNLRGLI